jgi:hypothetical protein
MMLAFSFRMILAKRGQQQLPSFYLYQYVDVFSPVPMPMMVVPSTIVTRSTVVGVGWMIHPTISVTVVCRGIPTVIRSAIIGWGVTVVVAVVAVSRTISVGVGSDTAD